MDLKIYYQKIREVEERLPQPEVLLVSQETADGGKPGVFTEAPRSIAAKMLVEGRARLATEQEAGDHQQRKQEARQLAEQMEAANRIQVTVVSDSELRSGKGSGRSPKQ